MRESTLFDLNTAKQEIVNELEILSNCLEDPTTTPEKYEYFQEEYFELDNLLDSFGQVINYFKSI